MRFHQQQQVPNISVDKRHTAHTRCDNARCPSLDKCRRFQDHSYDNMMTIFYARPLEMKDGKCGMFIDKASKEAKEFFPPAG